MLMPGSYHLKKVHVDRRTEPEVSNQCQGNTDGRVDEIGRGETSNSGPGRRKHDADSSLIHPASVG